MPKENSIHQTTDTPSTTPEPVILEEHVISKKPPVAQAPAPEIKIPTPQQSPVEMLPDVSFMPHPLGSVVSATPQQETPTSTLRVPGSSAGIQADMADILTGIRLPERKEFRAKADVRTFENRLAAQEPVLEAKQQAEVEPPTEPKKDFDIPSVHTLKDDLDYLVQGQKLSMVKAAALEQDKKSKSAAVEKVAHRPRRSTGRILKTVALAFVLVLVGGGALGAIALIAGQRKTDTPVPLSSIMFSEQTLSFPLDGLTARDVKSKLSLSRTQVPLSLGAMARLVPTYEQSTESGTATTIATTDQFFTAIGAQLPEGFTRSLSQEYFLGVHALDSTVPVLVIPVAVYERAFASMLSWEGRMNDDLAPLFTPIPAQVVTQDGTIISRTFEDVIIQNYDVRIMKDFSGTIRLLYAFPTRDILIITESPNSFIESLARLRAERRL